MDKKEKLYELLEKKVLTDQEKHDLNELTKDPELSSLYKTYLLAKKRVQEYAHPSFDEISDYVLYKNNVEPEDRFILTKVPLVEMHFRKCAKCNQLFLDLNEEYSDASAFVASEFNGKMKSSVNKSIHVSQSNRASYFNFRYALAAASVILILFIGTLSLSELTTPEAYQLAQIDDASDMYVTRGRATSDFQEGIKAIETDNYDTAIRFFKSDIEKNQNDETIFYSSYVLGLTYLQSAEQDFAGLFPSYDDHKVTEGIKNLKTAVEKNKSGRFPNVNFDAEFYIGKGYLMINNREEAKKYFTKVVNSKGSKMDEAANILSEL